MKTCFMLSPAKDKIWLADLSEPGTVEVALCKPRAAEPRDQKRKFSRQFRGSTTRAVFWIQFSVDLCKFVEGGRMKRSAVSFSREGSGLIWLEASSGASAKAHMLRWHTHLWVINEDIPGTRSGPAVAGPKISRTFPASKCASPKSVSIAGCAQPLSHPLDLNRVGPG